MAGMSANADSAVRRLEKLAQDGLGVMVFFGDADEFYMDACDWTEKRSVVWASAGEREELLGRFDSDDAAQDFQLHVVGRSPLNVLVG